MKAFMDKDFLLSTETAKKLYHEYAEVMPIIDYHCHINPQEIYEDRKFENITQVWLGADHYKWRQMRSNGVEEKYITGDASDREKWQLEIRCITGVIWNFKDTSDTKVIFAGILQRKFGTSVTKNCKTVCRQEK